MALHGHPLPWPIFTSKLSCFQDCRQSDYQRGSLARERSPGQVCAGLPNLPARSPTPPQPALTGRPVRAGYLHAGSPLVSTWALCSWSISRRERQQCQATGGCPASRPTSPSLRLPRPPPHPPELRRGRTHDGVRPGVGGFLDTLKSQKRSNAGGRRTTVPSLLACELTPTCSSSGGTPHSPPPTRFHCSISFICLPGISCFSPPSRGAKELKEICILIDIPGKGRGRLIAFLFKLNRLFR